MYREIAYGLLFLSLLFKTVALFKASNKDIPVKIREKEYKLFNRPANILILSGVALLLYAKYFV